MNERVGIHKGQADLGVEVSPSMNSDTNKRQAHPKSKHRRGAVIVLIALLLIPIIGAVALVVDIGSMYVVPAELQPYADAAELA